ncbi:hypothetical protein OCOL_001581 [Ordospora colligata]
MDFNEYNDKKKIESIDLRNENFTSLDGNQLKLFTNLKKLTIENTELESLPAEIGQLTQLQELVLRKNKLKSLPAEIGQLTQLQKLVLSYNQQLKSLPEQIGQLTQLQELNLIYNKLNSLPAEINGLKQLKKLVLSENQQLKSLPEQIGQLTQLQELYLSGNQLESLPEQIGQLIQLQKLYLSGNQLESLPDEIGQLTQLQELDLYGNQQLKSLPEQIGQLTQLQKLELRNNQLKLLPKQIGQLTQLKTLYLNGNQLKSLPEQIGQLTQLQELWLRNNQLKSLPKSIKNLRRLTLLNLIDNPIMETGTDENLGRSELQEHFMDNVLFEAVQKPENVKPISKEDAIKNASAQPFHWNLKKLKELVNNKLPKGNFTHEQMLEEWGKYSTQASIENNTLLTNYINKLYNPDMMPYSNPLMTPKFIPMAKDYLEAIVKEYPKLRNKADQGTDVDVDGIIESNIQIICEGIKKCADRQISELMFAFNLLMGQLKDQDADLKTRFEMAIASRKEAIFDEIFTPRASGQNVHVLTFWKLNLSDDLGFDFEFNSPFGDMGQDPFHGNAGNALEAFLIGFEPNIVIPLLTDEINEKGSFLSKAAEYIYNSTEINKSIRKTWCKMDDEEFYYITKVTNEFTRYYLLQMGILERAVDEQMDTST